MRAAGSEADGDGDMKVLNLYAGIGGNRKLWKDVEVVAVEYDSNIANIYRDFFPDDTVIIGDAHQYLIENYKEFDFIWSSPPCPTHSQYRYNVGVLAKGFSGVYPDMTLYQEIIFLKYHAKSKWVVENVRSYYEPLIPPLKVGRHYIWSNFYIPDIDTPSPEIRSTNMDRLQKNVGFDLSKYSGIDKRKILRNCVNSNLGNHILSCAINNTVIKNNTTQMEMKLC